MLPLFEVFGKRGGQGSWLDVSCRQHVAQEPSLNLSNSSASKRFQMVSWDVQVSQQGRGRDGSVCTTAPNPSPDWVWSSTSALFKSLSLNVCTKALEPRERRCK